MAHHNDTIPLHQTISIITIFLLIASASMVTYTVQQTNWIHETIAVNTRPIGECRHNYVSIFCHM